MPDNGDLYYQYVQTVAYTARAVARGYTNYTTYDDVEQDLWVHILRQPQAFRKLVQDERPDLARNALRRRAYSFCEEQRNISLGIPPEANEGPYNLAVVRELLPDVFSYEDWQSFAQKTDSQAHTKRIEATSDRLAMLIDVKTAVDRLSERNYSIVIGLYKYGYDDQEIADMLDISINSVKTTVARALGELVKLLNPTVKPSGVAHVGSRKVKSNAAARAEMENAW